MATWIWIVIGIAAVLVIGLLAFTMLRGRNAERRRAQAQNMRQEADNRARMAREREAIAKDISGQAREEHERAESLREKAAKIDPDHRDREPAQKAS